MRSRIKSTCAAFAAFTLTSLTANASSITVDSVTQRWPWNNKVDITYTVSGGQDVSAGVYAKIVFTATIGGAEYTIDGVSDIGANASDGQHTVTWTVPDSIKVKATDCTMTAKLTSADNPSGDDYMVVDLDTGAIAYEGLLSTQEASNERYNTDTYKQTKLVLRKVPIGSYQVGAANNGANTAKTWDLAKYNDGATYYIGIFPVTQSQYTKIVGSNPSSKTTNYTNSNLTYDLLCASDTIENRPVEAVSWQTLRGSDGLSHALGTLEPSSSGSFLQRLNNMAGLSADGYGFDLPTEIMWEIAARAGTTTTYWWGTDISAKSDNGKWYAIRSTVNTYDCTVAVGTVEPNAWGIYDGTGNVAEFCVDSMGLNNLANATSPYVAYLDTSATGVRNRGGSNWYLKDLAERGGYLSSYNGKTVSNPNCGFRVARLAR